MQKKINLILIISLCLLSISVLSGSASAWQMSFEGHSDDIARNKITGDIGVLDATYGHVNCCGKASVINSTVNKTLDIDEPWNGYLSYSGLNSGGLKLWLKLYDINNNCYYTSNLISAAGASWYRYTIKQLTPVSIGVYQDGTLVGTCTGYTASSSPKKIQLVFGDPVAGFQHDIYVDDITNEAFMIGCDELVIGTDTAQYYRIGYFMGAGETIRMKLYDTNYNLVYTYNTGALINEFNIPIANMSTQGRYSFGLYTVNGSNVVNRAVRTFVVGSEANNISSDYGTLTIDKSDYQPGENISVFATVSPYVAGCKVYTSIPKGTGSETYNVDVTSTDFFTKLSIPFDAVKSGSLFIYLVGHDNKVITYKTYNIFTVSGTSIAFDKPTYIAGENIGIDYNGVPPGSTVYLSIIDSGETVDTGQFNPGGIKGYYGFLLSSYKTGDQIIAVLKNSAGKILFTDSANILNGDYYLSGRIYNSKTGSAVATANVLVDVLSTTSDSIGNYQISAPAGNNSFTVNKTGYNNLSGNVNVYASKTTQNFFITPTETNSGYGIYGTVKSLKTGSILPSARVEIVNNDNSKTLTTYTNQYGYYSIKSNDVNGNCTIRVSKENYDPYAENLLISGYTYKDFSLNAIEGYNEVNYADNNGGKTAEQIAYEEKYGEMGKHPFDFNDDGSVSNDEYKYAFERLALLIGILAFMGFLTMINRRR
jgi:hypothetical protein